MYTHTARQSYIHIHTITYTTNIHNKHTHISYTYTITHSFCKQYIYLDNMYRHTSAMQHVCCVVVCLFSWMYPVDSVVVVCTLLSEEAAWLKYRPLETNTKLIFLHVVDVHISCVPCLYAKTAQTPSAKALLGVACSMGKVNKESRIHKTMHHPNNHHNLIYARGFH